MNSSIWIISIIMWMIGASMITSFVVDIISINNYIDKEELIYNIKNIMRVFYKTKIVS